VIGPRSKNSENSQIAMGDKKLAHSAQMFHYQHQKQQIIAMENRNAELNHNDDENDSDDNENDFTVYGECRGVFLSHVAK
jgi:Neural proliferation differentiation control-1 protein (NPDC1)